jgi:hypothetical protein
MLAQENCFHREIRETREKEPVFAYFAYFAVPSAFYIGTVLEPPFFSRSSWRFAIVSLRISHFPLRSADFQSAFSVIASAKPTASRRSRMLAFRAGPEISGLGEDLGRQRLCDSAALEPCLSCRAFRAFGGTPNA